MAVNVLNSAPPLPRAYDVPLLRLRLRLALLTMAILPTTLAMALVYSTFDQQSITDKLLLRDRSVAAANLVDGQLERAVSSIVLLAADAGLVQAAAIDPQAARARAESLFVRPFAGLARVTFADSGGQEVVALAGGRDVTSERIHDVSGILSLPPGEVSVAGPSDTADRLFLATPLRAPGGGAAAMGALMVEVSLAGLLEAGALGPADGRALYVIDRGSGAVLHGLPLGGAGDGPTSAEMAASQPRGLTDGHWPIGDDWHAAAASLRGPFEAWQVVLVGRVAPPQLPVALLGLLAALTILLVAITVWMSRQVVGPAQELARSREQLLELYEVARADALRDALTGLGNHRGFQEELDHQLEWHRRYKVPFALLMLDVDDLKLVNDSEGHSAGDEVMRELGRILSESTRYADRAFRVGGDEFAILMPHTTAQAALDIGRRLLNRTTSNASRPIHFSAGVSACPGLATTRTQLVAQADAALYWCKRHGRSSVAVFDPLRDGGADQSTAGSRSAQLATVIAQGQLRAVYQPVVDLRSGIVIGFEGLTRPLPESGFSNPGELFAAAEAAGRIVELDYACFDTVVGQAKGLGSNQLLSINLSPRTIEAPQFSAEWLVAALAHHAMDPRRVIIELTEQQGIEDLPQLERNLAALQRAGIRVAIDDVGAGNAGLRLLSQFRFDIVKVDLSLVQDGTRRDSSRAVLTSLRELAGRWGAYVVAEGLETVSQLRVVRELRLSAGQGYLLGRPMAAPTLARVDLASIEAGGVVMQARQRETDVSLPAARPVSN